MKKQDLKRIAHKIVELEKRAQTEPNFNYADAMEKLIWGLKLNDLLEIDYYIQSEKLLTK
jgi:hypothetical protein